VTQPLAVDEILGELGQLDDFSDGELASTDSLTRLHLAAATAAIRNYCGWHIFPRKTETVTVDGPGGMILLLPTLKLRAIASLTENGRMLTPDVDFEWSQKGTLRKRYWTDRYRAITATIDHGFASAPDLLETVYAIATRAASSPSGATVDTAGPFTLQYAQIAPGVAGGLGIMQHERQVIDLYRLPEEP
jgi:hypothetical protein